MAIDQAAATRWSVEGRHVVCQPCGETYTDYGQDGGGCPNCAATRQAAKELSDRYPREPGPEPALSWWLGILGGTAYYADPQDAAEGRDPIGHFPAGHVRKWGSGVRTWNGFISKISDPDAYHKFGWVRESPEAGVFKRKKREDAEKALVRALSTAGVG